MKLYHDIPASEGVENGLKRAKQMVTATYAPVRPLPMVNKTYAANGDYTYTPHFLTAGRPLQGILYSSVRRTEKYVGHNVSLETFFTAISNPNSIIYNRFIDAENQNVHAYYGIVCSSFASYVLDFDYRTACVNIPKIEGVEPADIRAPEDLRLLDILLDTKHHVALITDIERDARGKVRYITVSESVLPQTTSARYTPEQFHMYWFEDPTHNYEVYRYRHLDKIPYTPSPFVKLEGESGEPEINRVLMPDFGNKANYILGVDPVELSVFDKAFTSVEVTDPEGKTARYPVTDGKAVVRPEKPGFYRAAAVCGDKKSAFVEWCATDLVFTTDKTVYRAGERMRVCFKNSASDPLAIWQMNNRDTDRGIGAGVLKDLGSSGEIELPVPAKAAPAELYLLARNAYGFYSSPRMKLTIEP